MHLLTLQVPILSRMSVSLCLNPIYLTLTCAVKKWQSLEFCLINSGSQSNIQICVSYAFMLPVASGPNAICYGASSLGTWDLVRTGMMMNIICILTTW